MPAPAPEYDPFTELTRTATQLTMALDRHHALRLCDGHFPGDPLIPGSTLAGLAAEVATRLVAPTPAERWRLARIERATFARPARPDMAITLTATTSENDPGAVIVRIHGAHELLAKAALRFEAGS
jgi:3-hydroxymyristoyl/3-hydroxydecanoyl-(acyl carrier protein) dehydratase